MIKLLDLINHSRFTIIYPQVDPFLNINYPTLTALHLLKNNSHHITNTGQLLQSQLKQIKSQFSSPIAILPFKPSAKTEKICQEQGWLCLANPTRISRELEDKIKFTQLCDYHQLPTIPHQIAPLNSTNYQTAQTKFGPKLVIQTHFGWAGNSTFLSEDFSHIAKLVPPNTPSKFMPYLDGFTVTNNCCLTKFGLIQSPIARQLSNITKYSTNPFATTGRQWPSFVPDIVANKCQQITDKIGKIIKPFGYRGFFGIDFFVHQNQVLILEINPRLTASFGYYTKLEIEANFTPLFLFHLAEFLPLDYQIDLSQQQLRTTSKLIIGTEITPKDNLGKTISQHHQKEPIFRP